MNDDPKPGQIIEPGSGSNSTGGNNAQPTGFRPAPNPFETHAGASAAPSDMPTAPAAPPPVPPVQPPPPPSMEPAVSPAETPPTPGSGHPATPEPVVPTPPVPAAQPAPVPQPPVAPTVAPTDNPLNTQDATPTPPPIAQMPTDMVNTEPLPPAAAAPVSQTTEPQATQDDGKKAKKPGLLAKLGLGGKKPEADKPQPAGPPVPEGTQISWQAPEFVQTHKPVGWYLLVAGFFAVLIALAILTRQWLSIGLFALMGATLAVYANRKPRVLNYEMTNNHLMVGQKRYGYGDFNAYYQGHDYNQTVFDLVPDKRFGTLVSLPAPHDMIDQIDGVLAGSLPKVEPHDDAIDKFFRALRF
ncbi:hypothetical protein HYX70_01850 [Candidatus Saccharibacteria bacterium]|nr:hypothetical protein [Candidatus Saccharibacteria bacterium]